MSEFVPEGQSTIPSAPPPTTTAMETEEEDCPVCLNSLGDNNFIVTKCKHKICLPCFMNNYNKSLNGNLCPLCRTKIVRTRRNIYVSKSRTTFEASHLLYNMYDADETTFPVFKELLDFATSHSSNTSEFKEVLGRFIMSEFIDNYVNNLNITK
jgi:hypothetical protein